MVTRKAYKYRIYPTEDQMVFFARVFGCCRFVWNKMLAEKLEAYKEGKPIPQITPAKYKEEYPFLKEVDSLALANVQLQLEKAFRDHFKNPRHFKLPRFKRRRDKQSYNTNSVNNSIRVDFENGILILPKLKGGAKVKLHRYFKGKIKSAVVTKTRDGKYYVSILVETEEPRNKVRESRSRACGIDLGLEHFVTITTDYGTRKVRHPGYLRRAEERLKRLQRNLSRKQKDSKNCEKARLRLAKQHTYVSNARKEFLHKLSKAIIDENQVVVVEDLNVKGLLQTRLAKSISDSGWSRFLFYLEYKAQWYGRSFVKMGRCFPSSKLCSCCGYKKEDLTLSDRTWTCPVCRVTHDRDINASINLYKVGLGRPEFRPVEGGSGG
jgi:putative transposase